MSPNETPLCFFITSDLSEFSTGLRKDINLKGKKKRSDVMSCEKTVRLERITLKDTYL